LLKTPLLLTPITMVVKPTKKPLKKDSGISSLETKIIETQSYLWKNH
jgi:hypothetical protein